MKGTKIINYSSLGITKILNPVEGSISYIQWLQGITSSVYTLDTCGVFHTSTPSGSN